MARMRARALAFEPACVHNTRMRACQGACVYLVQPRDTALPLVEVCITSVDLGLDGADKRAHAFVRRPRADRAHFVEVEPEPRAHARDRAVAARHARAELLERRRDRRDHPPHIVRVACCALAAVRGRLLDAHERAHRGERIGDLGRGRRRLLRREPQLRGLGCSVVLAGRQLLLELRRLDLAAVELCLQLLHLRKDQVVRLAQPRDRVQPFLRRPPWRQPLAYGAQPVDSRRPSLQHRRREVGHHHAELLERLLDAAQLVLEVRLLVAARRLLESPRLVGLALQLLHSVGAGAKLRLQSLDIAPRPVELRLELGADRLARALAARDLRHHYI